MGTKTGIERAGHPPTGQPVGALTGVTFGSQDSDSFQYNPNTGRMTQYSFNVNGQSDVGKLQWNTNGTLAQLAITNPFNAQDNQTCNNTYDNLVRVGSNTCNYNSQTIWSQAFGYDPFGNISKSGSAAWLPNYNNAKNQYLSGWNGVAYDPGGNGNLLNDTFNSYTWDVYGDMLSVSPISGNSVSVTYDAFGRVVESQNGTSTPDQYVYSPAGGPYMAQTSNQALVVAATPLPGGTNAIFYFSSGITFYAHSDWQGSTRLISGPGRGVTPSMAYAPFGEGYSDGNGTSTFVIFTEGGYAPLVDPGLDGGGTLLDFMYRHYSPSQGRWISPDPAGISAANLANPQSWNRYAYVLNNPLSNVDPSGLDCVYPPDYNGPADYETKGGFRVSLGDCHDSNDSGFYFDGTVDPNLIGMDSQTGDISASVDGGPIQCAGDCPTVSATVTATPLGPNNSLLSRLAMWLSGSAINVSGYLPLHRFYFPIGEAPFPVASLGGSVSFTWIPDTNTWCAGVGGGGAVPSDAKELSLSIYPASNASHTQNVVSSWGWSLSGQPSPSLGYSVLSNSSGTLGGPSIATSSGLQATYGWTGCKSF